MGCIELMDYEILLSRISFKEGREFIKKNFKEVYEVEPGYKLFDVYLIGVPPITIAVEDESVIFPYVKPCHGTFVLKIEGEKEIELLRTKVGKKRRK
jgi:hypothetical protein